MINYKGINLTHILNLTQSSHIFMILICWKIKQEIRIIFLALKDIWVSCDYKYLAMVFFLDEALNFLNHSYTYIYIYIYIYNGKNSVEWYLYKCISNTMILVRQSS